MSSPAARVYMQYAEDGCRWHRLLQPARHLGRDFPDVEFFCSLNHEPPDQGFDVYAMHGLLHWDTYKRVAAWKGRGKRFVWSVDDDFLTVPDSNPAKPLPEFANSYYLSRMAADLIVCSTPPLAATFPGFPTATAPNLLDLDYYALTGKPAPEPQPGHPLRILWAGSLTHSRDVMVAEPAVRHLLTAHPGKVEVIFLGQGPPAGLVRDFLHAGLRHLPGVQFAHYWPTLAAVRPHVVLAPLDRDEFNRSKSNLRVLEGWALSAAVVATDWSEYGVIRHGGDGLLAADSDEFTAHLEAVCTDPDLRRRLAEAGRKRVEDEWSWQSRKAREPWRQVVGRMLEGVR